jgi:chaperonin GroEL
MRGAVCSKAWISLGPRGRNVVIEKGPGAPRSTKDGVTVAREIELEDHFENIGARMLREIAARANEEAGDGTTTAIVLAQAILKEGLKPVTVGMNPMEVKRGIDLAIGAVDRALAGRSCPVEMHEAIRQVAEVASDGDRQGAELLADAAERIGRNGAISVERAETLDTSLEVADGMQLDRGAEQEHREALDDEAAGRAHEDLRVAGQDRAVHGGDDGQGRKCWATMSRLTPQ